LLDLMLPGRSGLEVLDEVRARKPELPVIVVTARARSSSASRASTAAPTTM
jgi:CheY-like chemotaxis protein